MFWQSFTRGAQWLVALFFHLSFRSVDTLGLHINEARRCRPTNAPLQTRALTCGQLHLSRAAQHLVLGLHQTVNLLIQNIKSCPCAPPPTCLECESIRYPI